jgi:predicted TIM-barrel fold metal-dependent hydrolase
MSTPTVPEYNATGLDYRQRDHFRYQGPPIIDVHAHVMRTRPTDTGDGPPPRGELGATTDQAGIMLGQAEQFGIGLTYSMCYPEDIAPLRQRFGDRIAFNGSIHKRPDEPDEAAYRLLDQFVQARVRLIKLWAAPRGRERGLLLDTPWRIESVKRARAAGIRAVMVHVGDPDIWFERVYADVAKYGSKKDQYRPLERMLQEFPDLTWIAAHMGGDVEHPDHLEALIERYPNLHFDTSATKWQVREASARRDAVRGLIMRHPRRFLFGSDLVTRHGLVAEHYVSRYWCQRTLWESGWEGSSPIADSDYTPGTNGASTPTLRGLALPADVLDLVYHANAERLLG